jgi:hypothetical protein
MTQVALRSGLIGGLVCVLYNFTLYLAGLEYFAHRWLPMGIFVIVFFFQFQTAYTVRRNNSTSDQSAGSLDTSVGSASPSAMGYLSYGQAYKVMVIVGLLSLAVLMLYNIILYNVVNTDLASMVKEITIERMVQTMENWNVADTIIDETVTEFDKVLEDSYKPLGAIKSFLVQSLFIVVMTAFFALIPKRIAAY